MGWGVGGWWLVPILRKNFHPFPCPPTLLLMNQILSWKNKLKYTGVNITMLNLHQQNIKSVSWKRFIESVKHLSWRLKTMLEKSSNLDV